MGWAVAALCLVVGVAGLPSAPWAVADDDLAPLVDPPDDDLAPLIPIPKDAPAPDPTQSDRSSLVGHQIRPPQATVRVREAVSLVVKDCFLNQDAEPSYIECNDKLAPGLEMAPLLAPFKVSGWSVNGVAGGNGVVGRVASQGDKEATYTAPAKVPTPPVVAVSAEVSTEGAGKRMVVANITIVDGLSYLNEVRFEGRREEQGTITDYAGVAELDFVHAESFESGIRYDLQLTKNTRVVFDKWTERNDSETCELIPRSNAPNPQAPYTGTLFIYSSLHSYVFQALLDTHGMAHCRDGDSKYDKEVSPRVLLNTSKGGLDPGLQPLGDAERLEGTATMTMHSDEDEEDTVTQTVRWSATKFTN